MVLTIKLCCYCNAVSIVTVFSLKSVQLQFDIFLAGRFALMQEIPILQKGNNYTPYDLSLSCVLLILFDFIILELQE